MLAASVVLSLAYVPNPLSTTIKWPSRPAVAATGPALSQPCCTCLHTLLRPQQPQRPSPCMLEGAPESRKRGTQLVVLIIATTVALQFEWRFFLGFVAGVAVDKLARKMEQVDFLPGGLKPPKVEVSKVTIGEGADADIYTEISWLPDD